MRRFVLAVAIALLSSPAFAAGTHSLFQGFLSFGDDDAPSAASVTSERPARTTKASLTTRTRTPAATGGLVITVDISTQSMTVADEWNTIYTFDVSTGRKGYPTPTGSFRPIRMHEMWYSSKYENSPMPYSIFFHGGYAIHGTGDLKHLGHVASHGCVRLDPKNAKLLYELVKDVGMGNTKVLLIRS